MGDLTKKYQVKDPLDRIQAYDLTIRDLGAAPGYGDYGSL